MAEGKQWRRLTGERKFRIFLETREPDAPVGEILRRHGLTLEDLRAIEDTMGGPAIGELQVQAEATSQEYERVCRELREKERALAELSVEYTLLKKSERSGSPSGGAGHRDRCAIGHYWRAAAELGRGSGGPTAGRGNASQGRGSLLGRVFRTSDVPGSRRDQLRAARDDSGSHAQRTLRFLLPGGVFASADVSSPGNARRRQAPPRVRVWALGPPQGAREGVRELARQVSGPDRAGKPVTT